MAKGLSGWTQEDVELFLKVHDFVPGKQKKGSHETRIRINHDSGEEFVVEINVTKSAYPPRTLETMIRQSGFSKKHWRKWVQLNKRLRKKAACCK